MTTIYAAIFSFAFVSLANVGISARLATGSSRGSEASSAVSLSWDETFMAQELIQIGVLSVIPYLFEMLIEQGLFKALLSVLHQVR